MARYYAQPANSVKYVDGTSLEDVKGFAKQWSKQTRAPVTVYRDTGTGFDPVIARYKRGRLVFDQSKYV